MPERKLHLKKSYTILPLHADYINILSLKLSNKENRLISSSEVLRIIIDKHIKDSK